MTRRPGCGTYAGIEAHKRAAEPSCDACKAARAEYMREYMARNDKAREANIKGNKERRQAVATLVARHQDEYQQILAGIRAGAS